MEIINTAVFFSILILLTIEDIREKKIMIIPPLLFCAYIFVVHIFSPTLEISEMLLGVVFGGIMMAVSFLSKGRIGMGDAVIYTCMIGPLFGGLKALAVLFTASLSSAVFSCIYILRASVMWRRRAYLSLSRKSSSRSGCAILTPSSRNILRR